MNETFVIIPLEDGTFSIQRWNTLTGQYEPMENMIFPTMELAKNQLDICNDSIEEDNE